ncbi:biosynthetic arginine decarboxylase [Roseofilum casamattae]|uniref:Biosynthetic arginine decarboxylase n=1 Tax=Roseofilum casamattae BLCC-M143 TaxID=3022442 RepID=A0ABT7BTB8_9CYAN|nr:biosynthetic arginine decarboxylase [Roseofilum casamattae]MDJ1182432.1 biosynthetic arginine decarboxylase [Roseofilum casamattae BLCC-M143]
MGVEIVPTVEETLNGATLPYEGPATNAPENEPESPSNWRIEDSEQLYRITEWGHPYFAIDAAGHVIVSPKGDRGGSLDLYELIEALKQRDIDLPFVIRFSDILADRVERLNACFAQAITRYNYPSTYQGVFPVKCNQHRQLVEDLVEFGQPFQFGLEAGSKPELLIALALLKTPNCPLICNGYKDREYIETAILSRRLGKNTIVVLEQLEEVELVINAARELGVVPVVGVRAKLTSKGEGRWSTSTGEGAKFGLTIPEIVRVIQRLEEVDLLSSLQLLHFHIGSQISSIGTIKDAIREASQIYVQLAKNGAQMCYLDVGGGLAIDYDGSKTNFHASKNYNMQNYANDIVAEVKEACEQGQVDAPTLISESGRAIASHQSVLVFDVLGVSESPTGAPVTSENNDHLILRNLWETYQAIQVENYQECYHDAIQFKEEAISLFNFGYFTLAQRAQAEQLYWACCEKILQIIRTEDYVPDDLEDLETSMASTYYINLSVFQSVPDSWAIEQLFPIMPLHRLDENPTCRGTLADLTCDSDGKINKFIDLRDVKSLLELHPWKPGEPYYLGLFLGGAYQEIMGSLHNLFGDTNAVHISLTPKGYKVKQVVKGDTMAEVLGYVGHDRDDLIESMRQQTESALEEGIISLSESQRLLNNYTQSLNRYTYLSVDSQ